MALSHFLYVAGGSDFNLASASVQMDAELFQQALTAYEDEFPKKVPEPKFDKGSDKARHVCFIFNMASALALLDIVQDVQGSASKRSASNSPSRDGSWKKQNTWKGSWKKW